MTIEEMPRTKRVSASQRVDYLTLPRPDAGERLEIAYVQTYQNGSGEERPDPLVGIRFHDLLDWWRMDTDGMSMDRDALEHPAYRRIVEDLGAAAIPFMLRDLRDNSGHWFEALRELSGEPNLDAPAKGNMRKARDLWLSWGKTRRVI